MKWVGSSTSLLIRHLWGKHSSKLDEKHKKCAELGLLDGFVTNTEVCLHLILFSKTKTNSKFLDIYIRSFPPVFIKMGDL
jgi:hypothetical protein